MAIMETSTICFEHAWAGKVGTKCPKCVVATNEKKAAETVRWSGLTLEEKLLELKRRVERIESAPCPNTTIF